MNFWARQAEARQRSRWLMAIFTAAVLAIVLAVNFVVLSLLALLDAGQPVVADSLWLARHPQAAVTTTLVVLAIIGIANLYKTMSLSTGGGAVARSLGGLRVQADTSDPLQQRLVHVVEEMAIASGVPVPAVYVLEQEDGINAFAAGHTPANAAIAVTRGALQNLSRAELQGVIGHEFSHILNGDMRLNIRIMGLLFGLLVIAIAGRTVSWYAPRQSDSRRGSGGLLIVAGVLVMALGYVGVFFGRLIQAAVSRQRELLADASAVQFTRDTTGLRDALLKIGSVRGSRIRHPDAEEVAHMLFAPGMTRWFATHPPLLVRIRALDPGFDPAQFDNLRLEVKPQPLGVVEVVSKDQLPRSFYTGQITGHRSVPLQPAALPGLIGNPGAREVAEARVLREALSDKYAGDEGDHLAGPPRCCLRWLWTPHRRSAVSNCRKYARAWVPVWRPTSLNRVPESPGWTTVCIWRCWARSCRCCGSCRSPGDAGSSTAWARCVAPMALPVSSSTRCAHWPAAISVSRWTRNTPQGRCRLPIRDRNCRSCCPPSPRRATRSRRRQSRPSRRA
jgi:Zn-dependent protease with chaperone function